MKAHTYKNSVFTEIDVDVIEEQPLTIILNGEEFITLLVYPHDIDELTVGFLRSEGLISSMQDIKRLTVSRDLTRVEVEATVDRVNRHLHERRIITTGCGKGSVFYFALDSLKCPAVTTDTKMNAAILIEAMHSFLTKRGKNGLHACAIYDGHTMVEREDVGRHNAMDKVAGYCLLKGLDTSGSVILTTGRISSEILIKAAKLGAGIVASRSTPTSLAIEVAEKVSITIAGYVRGGSMTVYTSPERITE